MGADRLELDGDGGSPDENRAILRSFVEALANADADAAGELVDAARSSTTAPAGARASFDSVLDVAADAARGDARPHATRSTRRAWSARATRSPAHSVVRGTHTGEALYGAEPSGNEVVWTHSDFVRLSGGKIVERWTATDMLTLFQQAGVLPSMGG